MSENKAFVVVLLFTVKNTSVEGFTLGARRSGKSFLYPPPASLLIDYKCSFPCEEQSLRVNNKILFTNGTTAGINGLIQLTLHVVYCILGPFKGSL